MNEETGYKYTKTDASGMIGAIIILGIGIWVSSYINNSIPDFVGVFGPPQIIIWMPAIMCSVPLIICTYLMATANRRARAKSESPTVYRYRDETIVYTGDYELPKKPTEEANDTVYLIPANCPSCNRHLSAEGVDWIGPLQAKCPHCGATVDAEERK